MRADVCLAFLALGVALLSNAEQVLLADASASASVQKIASPEGFGIKVSFPPVITLDDVSNEEMTQVLSHFYAEEALSAFLKSQKGIAFQKAKTEDSLLEDGRVQWSFSVPASAIFEADVEVVEVRKEIVGKKSPVAKPDAKTRLLDFRSSCFRDLRIAESLFAEEVAKCKDDQARSKLRQRIENAIAALQEKIRNDDNLFRAEKKELLEKADKVESFLLQEVSGGAGGNAAPKKGLPLPITDAVFTAPFDRILENDPILLQHDGARFVDLGNGTIAIVAVGSARADNEDRDDIAEMMASAALAKLNAGEESVVENRIERNYRRSSGSEGASESMEMKRTSKTTVNAADFHKLGEKVGTWLSKDGKRFFMAFGRIVKQRKDNE